MTLALMMLVLCVIAITLSAVRSEWNTLLWQVNTLLWVLIAMRCM